MGAEHCGKHVFCEKPLATTAAAAQRMVDTPRDHGVLLWEAMVFRYHPRTRRLRGLLYGGFDSLTSPGAQLIGSGGSLLIEQPTHPYEEIRTGRPSAARRSGPRARFTATPSQPPRYRNRRLGQSGSPRSHRSQLVWYPLVDALALHGGEHHHTIIAIMSQT